MRTLALAAFAALLFAPAALATESLGARPNDSTADRAALRRAHDDDSAPTLAAASKPSPTAKRPPPKKKRPPPDRSRPAPVAKGNPVNIGLGAAGGAALGSFIGAASVAPAIVIATGVFATPTVPVVIAATVIGIGIGVATPFMAGIGGGAAVLLMDPRARPDEWSGLLQCAASGYCLGANLVFGTVLGNLCGGGFCGAPSQQPGIPSPDRAAEWTAGTAIAGLVAGTVVGGLIGWAAGDPNDPFIPVTLGAGAGAVLGSAAAAGVGGAIATIVRR